MAAEPRVPVQSLEDCIRNRNLFLVHVGHGWFVMRVTGDDSVLGGAIPLPELNKRLVKAAMINAIAKIVDVATLQKYLDAARVEAGELFKRLNKPLHDSGYEEVLSVSRGC